jgi:hypothetical protein
MKTIPLEQLSIYLPYKLKVKFSDEDFAEIVGLELGRILLISDRGDYGSCDYNGIGKPLLHPLSNYKDVNSECMNNLGTDLIHQCIISELANKWINVSQVPYGTIQEMAKNHIDIFSWIDQGLAEPIK